MTSPEQTATDLEDIVLDWLYERYGVESAQARSFRGQMSVASSPKARIRTCIRKLRERARDEQVS